MIPYKKTPAETGDCAPKHLRTVALQCNFEGGPRQTLKIPQRWAEFGFDTEQLFHTHAELYSAVFDAARHGALLEKYLAESRRRGIKIILYLNCHILLASQAARAADWALVDKSGAYAKLYGTYYGCCLNSTWTDYFLGVIDSLAPYDLHGVFFDGPSSTPCFCRRCQKLFRARHGGAMRKAAPAILAEFELAARLNFLQQAYARVKRVNPGWLAYCNMGLLHGRAGAADMRALLACNDIVGTEGGFQFYGPPAAVDIWRCGLHAKTAEALADAKPRVIFMAGDHKPWSWYLHTPAETRLCYASALANGASVWYGIHSATSLLRSRTGAAARDMVQFEKKHAELYADTASAAEIALFHSFDTAKNYTSSGEKTDLYASAGDRRSGARGDYQAGLNGAAGALFRSGLAFDVMTELNAGQLPRYRAVVLPNIACMSAELGARLRAFVKQGGILLADGETSLFDEHFRQRRNFLLHDLLGADFKGYRQYQTHDYFSLQGQLDIFAAEGVALLPAPLLALDVKAAARDVQGRLCPPLAGRYAGRPAPAKYPFVMARRYGRGRVYYLAGMFFEFYRKFAIAHHDRLVRQMLTRHALPAVEMLGGNGAVELTVRRCGARPGRLIHLVNYTGGMRRPIAQVTPLTDLSLRVRGRVHRARALVAGRSLRVDRGGVIKLPPLREFEVVWVE